MEERRRHPRLDIPLEVEFRLQSDDEWRQGILLNLSAGGAAMMVERAPAAGAEMAGLRFTLPAEGGHEAIAIEVGAVVVRSEPRPLVGRQDNRLLGLQFVDMEEQAFHAVQQFVFRRLMGTAGADAATPASPRLRMERPISVRYENLEEFFDEVSVDLSESGMFLRSTDPRPPGAVFNFRFQLGEDLSLIEGRAEVVWTRRKPEGRDRPAGMGVRFLNLDVASRQLIRRLVEQRQKAESPLEPAAGKPPLGPRPAGPAPGPVPHPPPAEAAAAAAGSPTPPLPPLPVPDATASAARPPAASPRPRAAADSEDLRHQLEYSKAALKTAERALRTSESKREEVVKRLTEVSEERSTLRRKLGALEAVKRELSGELYQVQAKLTRVKEQSRDRESALRGKLEQAAGSSGEAGEQVALLQQALDESQQARQRLTARAERAAEEQTVLRSELQRLEETRRGLAAELEAARAETSRIKDGFRVREAKLLADLDRRAPAPEPVPPPAAAKLQPPEPSVQSPPTARRRPAAALAPLLLGALLGGVIGVGGLRFFERGARPGARLAERPAGDPGSADRTTPAATRGGRANAASPSGSATAVIEDAATRGASPGAAPAIPPPTAGSPAATAGALPPLDRPSVAAAATPDPATAEAAVAAWANAWSGQQVDGYLAAYSGAFRPPDGAARADWEARRRERLLAPRRIAVSIGPLDSRQPGPDRLEVSFDQAYESDTYSDQVRKTLTLVWEDGGWKIAAERSEP